MSEKQKALLWSSWRGYLVEVKHIKPCKLPSFKVAKDASRFTDNDFGETSSDRTPY
jgi:hypothetical protein